VFTFNSSLVSVLINRYNRLCGNSKESYVVTIPRSRGNKRDRPISKTPSNSPSSGPTSLDEFCDGIIGDGVHFEEGDDC